MGTVSDFWATVYKKRKIALSTLNTSFDAAAKINQYPSSRDYLQAMNLQDEEIKSVFRDFVNYVVEVRNYLKNPKP